MARLEFIEKIPETLGISGFVIIVLAVLILIILFVIYRFLRKPKPMEVKLGEGKKEMPVETKPVEDKEVRLEKRLVRLKEKLEGIERVRKSEGKSPSEL